MWRVAVLVLLGCVGGFCAGCAQDRPGQTVPFMQDLNTLIEPTEQFFDAPSAVMPPAPSGPAR
jgi:hypothetical protein